MDDLSPVMPTMAAWKGVQAMYGDYQRRPSGGGRDTDRRSISPAIFARITAVASGLVNATEVLGGTFADFATARTWTSLKVIGPPLKVGLITELECIITPTGYQWIAHGYESRVLDWGADGATSPFIVEDVSGTLTPRVKTKKTTNGYTWTDEKINMAGKECI